MLGRMAAGAFVLVVGCVSSLAADSLFKTPVISVKPYAMDFGSVAAKTSVTNSIVVENWGGGKLVGKVIVARPFKILSGGTYRLGASDAQIVTVVYTPSGAALDTNVLKFTGGGGALVPGFGKTIEKRDR
jgi:hypothetical protein